jgi:tetratricopeptide (TPR) repeat protein
LDQRQECLDWAERGFSLARDLDDKGLVVRAMGYRAIARIDTADPEEGLNEGRQALDLALSLGLGGETARLYSNVGNRVEDHDPRAGLELIQEGIMFAERRGLVVDAMWMKGGLSYRLFWRGHWDEALRLAEEVAASSRDPWTRLQAVITKAEVLLHRGDLEIAASLMEEVVPQARRVAREWGLAYTLAIAALVEWRRGRSSEAQTLLDEIERIDTPPLDWGLLDILRTSLGVEDATGVRRLVAGANPPMSELERHVSVTARAMLAEVEGRLDEGAELYRESAKRWGEFGAIPRQGEALIAAGRCLVGLERLDEAGLRLDEARKVIEPLGAQLLLDEIDELRSRAAALSS